MVPVPDARRQPRRWRVAPGPLDREDDAPARSWPLRGRPPVDRLRDARTPRSGGEGTGLGPSRSASRLELSAGDHVCVFHRGSERGAPSPRSWAGSTALSRRRCARCSAAWRSTSDSPRSPSPTRARRAAPSRCARLTGLPGGGSRDRHGKLRAWAGPDRPDRTRRTTPPAAGVAYGRDRGAGQPGRRLGGTPDGRELPHQAVAVPDGVDRATITRAVHESGRRIYATVTAAPQIGHHQRSAGEAQAPIVAEEGPERSTRWPGRGCPGR